MLKNASFLAHNDTVDGSEIPNNHRLDVEKTLLITEYKLPLPQLVNAGFQPSTGSPTMKSFKPVPTSICWTSAVSVLEWDVDLGSRAVQNKGFCWCKPSLTCYHVGIPRVWGELIQQRKDGFLLDWAGLNAEEKVVETPQRCVTYLLGGGPSEASKVHEKEPESMNFTPHVSLGNLPISLREKNITCFP